MLITATALLLAVGGCGQASESTAPPAAGGDASDSPTPRTSAKLESGRDVCALVTLAEASEIMGQAAAVDTEDKKPVAGKDCIWLGKNPSLHQLHLQVLQGKSFYGPTRWAGTAESIPSLGDEAFIVRKSVLGATVGSRSGEAVVFLNYQILLTKDPNPAAAADKMIKLASIIMGRL